MKHKHKTSLILQISIFFLISVILTAVLSGYILDRIANRNVEREKKDLTLGVALDVEKSIKEYSSYDWVINYLIKHKNDKFDFEYDSSASTSKKAHRFLQKHKGSEIASITASELDSFSEKDQKTFVEIVYNRWILRYNDVMASYKLKFLYFFAADDDYSEVTFIINGAQKGVERGTVQGQAYPFGVKVKTTSDQKKAFKKLRKSDNHFVYSEDYLDRYRYLCRIGNKNIVTGMTLDLTDVKQNIASQSRQSISVFMCLQIILAIVCLTLIYLYALRPLKKVEKSVGKYTQDKNAPKVLNQLSKINSRNEIGSLSDGVSDMINELEEHMRRIKAVTAENERISAELDLAKRIQEEMLPSVFPPFPEKTEFDIYAVMDPAKEVGGDFYDFFMVDDDHLALVVADVSGKGIPAALFMMIAKTLLKNRVLLGGTLSQILEDVNGQLMGHNTNMFVTVWLAVVDIKTGEGIAANAGHEHPVLRHKNGEYELIKYRHSPAVSMIEGVKFREHSFKLEKGDRVFVYTDGLPEAMNKKDELFGTDRMIEALNSKPDCNAEQLIEKVTAEVNRFVDGAEQSDDMTMLVFDYYG